MKKYLFLSLILLISPALLFGQKVKNNIEAKADAYVKPYLEMGVFSGSVLIAKSGKILLKKGYGMADFEQNVPNTPQTKFQIASISKVFTEMAIRLLEERGKLSTNDSLNKFIPDFPSGDKITIDHLINHRSGIVGDLTDFKTPQSTEQVVELIKKLPLAYEPGKDSRYSNHGYRLLAYIIEKVSGKSYGQFLKENIFDVLSLMETGHARPETIVKNRARGYVPVGYIGFENAAFIDWTNKTGNGSLYSTVEDLYKWDRALYTETILKKSAIEKLFSVQERFGRRYNILSGGSPGFSAEMFRFIDDDLCVIVLANNYSTTSRLIARDLSAIALGEKYEIPELTKVSKIDSTILESYVGTYEFGSDFFFPGTKIIINQEGGQLVSKSRTKLVLIPQSNVKFLDRFNWATITFVKDNDGKVNKYIWRYDGRDCIAKKIASK